MEPLTQPNYRIFRGCGGSYGIARYINDTLDIPLPLPRKCDIPPNTPKEVYTLPGFSLATFHFDVFGRPPSPQEARKKSPGAGHETCTLPPNCFRHF